jgi:hypothetical protein
MLQFFYKILHLNLLLAHFKEAKLKAIKNYAISQKIIFKKFYFKVMFFQPNLMGKNIIRFFFGTEEVRFSENHKFTKSKRGKQMYSLFHRFRSW